MNGPSTSKSLYHVVQEKSQASLMCLLSISSQHQLVDIFTKPLPPPAFTNILSKLGLFDIFQPPPWRDNRGRCSADAKMQYTRNYLAFLFLFKHAPATFSLSLHLTVVFFLLFLLVIVAHGVVCPS